MTPRRCHTATLDTPLGAIVVAVDDAGALVRVRLPGERTGSPAADAAVAAAIADPDRCAPALAQLREYFAGTRRTFTLPLAPLGTPFQRRAWAVLPTIPFGQTISYQEQARRLGAPSAMRAVGGANGRNPLPIVVPCHRVVGKDGSLTGFGAGLPWKRFLLALEQRVLGTAGDVAATA